MTSDNEWTAKQPIVNVNIEEIVDRTQCLLYAVNVARVLKFFIQSDCLNHHEFYSKYGHNDHQS